ncbi:hypothetical protein [Methanococcoides sp. LMO-2]|uniref:Uncharacterized protein n=1 Tax=Methanococcoides cohabitans TaxID=3136559 RepID=A0ABU9KV59_9EURY
MDMEEKKLMANLTRDERYSEELKRKGVSKNLYDANRNVTCPQCGTTFNLFYSRAKLCTGCPESVNGCEHARCVHCDTEFPLNNFMSGMSSRTMSNYLGSVVKRYQDTFGYSQWE